MRITQRGNGEIENDQCGLANVRSIQFNHFAVCRVKVSFSLTVTSFMHAMFIRHLNRERSTHSITADD
jgi:hypothetical protein